MVTRIAGSIFLLLILLSAAPARAQDARAEFERASALFKEKKYEDALPHFQRAYVLSNKRASAIRGLAQCEWLLGKYDLAIEHFREYLATTPKPDDSAAIQQTIREIEKERQANAPPPPPTTTIDVEAPPKAEPPPPAPPPEPETEASAGETVVTPQDPPPIQNKPTPLTPPPQQPQSGSIIANPWLWVAIGTTTLVVLGVVLIVAADSGPGGGGLTPLGLERRGLSVSF